MVLHRLLLLDTIVDEVQVRFVDLGGLEATPSLVSGLLDATDDFHASLRLLQD